MQEWIDACKGGPATCSSFDVASRLTEVCLMGVLPLRLGRSVDYTAEGDVANEPQAAAFIQSEERKDWL